MLTLISCRESASASNTFGPHVIPGQSDFFQGGPLGWPILIHGYNRTEGQAWNDFTPFSAALGEDCIVYSWPGGCHPLDFPAAEVRATLAGYRLRDVFSMRSLRAPGDSIVTHSLGARVALTALQHGAFRVNQLILMGAAVDWDVFQTGGEFANVPACCESIHILFSSRDEVLKLAFPFGDIGGDCRALGLDGPCDPLSVPANVILHDFSASIETHGAYVTDPDCSGMVRQFLRR